MDEIPLLHSPAELAALLNSQLTLLGIDESGLHDWRPAVEGRLSEEQVEELARDMLVRLIGMEPEGL